MYKLTHRKLSTKNNYALTYFRRLFGDANYCLKGGI